VENIQDDRRSKVFRSTTNSDHVYFDFGAAEPVDSFVAVGDYINGLGFTAASLELNNVATWTMGALATIPITIDAVNQIAFGKIVTAVNARYAKLILTSTLGYCEVSNIFIGMEDEIGTNDFQFPLAYKENNSAIVQTNRFGQKFIDEINVRKSFKGSIASMTNAECEIIYDMVNDRSSTKPLFMRIQDAQVFLDGNRTAGMYYLATDPEFAYTQGGFWAVSLELEEAM
jgi:hypothetical protein